MKWIGTIVGVLFLIFAIRAVFNNDVNPEVETSVPVFSSSSEIAPIESSSYGSRGYNGYYEGDSLKSISSDDAKSEHWDEIKDYLQSDTIEACRNGGNCYDLDAEISGGSIQRLDFNNGGYLNFDEDVDEDGNASGDDYHGDSWEFNIDDSTIDDAVEEWADDNGYELE